MGSKSDFDLIQAAESLLEDAKNLVAATQSGPTSNDEEIILRQGIAQAAKKIAFETAPPIDVVKSDWIVVRLHTSTHHHHLPLANPPLP
jgi:hypothetical protein